MPPVYLTALFAVHHNIVSIGAAGCIGQGAAAQKFEVRDMLSGEDGVGQKNSTAIEQARDVGDGQGLLEVIVIDEYVGGDY